MCSEQLMTLTEAFDLYKLDCIVFRNQSAKTEENHYVCLRALILFFGDVHIESLTFEDIRNWKIELDKRRSPTTVRCYIVKLRVVLAYFIAKGVKVVDPMLIPVPQRASRVPDFLYSDDVTRLYRAVATTSPGYSKVNRLRNTAVVSLLYASGIRVSELCSLDRANIKGMTFTVVGKGGKARLCFMDERAAKAIQQYLKVRNDQNPALFISIQNGRRITPGGVQVVFRLASKKAGFTVPVHPHTLRHSFATNLLQNNANMRYVQVMLGHSSLETTQMYTHVVDLDLQAAYEQHHKI